MGECMDARVILVPELTTKPVSLFSCIILRDAHLPAAASALFALPTEHAHALALATLQRAHSLGLVRARASDPRTAVTLMGLQFPNRVGLAAGFDKNGRYIDALGALGFGFVEVGTVTPRPQPGQPRPRLFRVPEAGALINRMGFPNEGAAAVAARLAQRRFAGVCGVNIGKNAATPIDAARRRLPRMLPHRRAARRLRGDQRVVAEHRRSAAAAGGRPVAADRRVRWSKRADSCRVPRRVGCHCW